LAEKKHQCKTLASDVALLTECLHDEQKALETERAKNLQRQAAFEKVASERAQLKKQVAALQRQIEPLLKQVARLQADLGSERQTLKNSQRRNRDSIEAIQRGAVGGKPRATTDEDVRTRAKAKDMADDVGDVSDDLQTNTRNYEDDDDLDAARIAEWVARKRPQAAVISESRSQWLRSPNNIVRKEDISNGARRGSEKLSEGSPPTTSLDKSGHERKPSSNDGVTRRQSSPQTAPVSVTPVTSRSERDPLGTSTRPRTARGRPDSPNSPNIQAIPGFALPSAN
jgi:hypothetical protein